ncbi:hypothetical protein FRB96_002381 [Tulasnella sp. 330]|nr:hypothetical protein FRB96_002381 [Tulasnella sp. 330]KAG8883103.1 hypothetical protein FRB97_007240 [Tulasnella sp. 331]
MLTGSDGFVPEPFFLTESLRKESRFHDPLDDSLFSRASSVQNFRSWKGSGGSSSESSSGAATPQSSTATLLVRSSRPIAQPPSYIEGSNHLTWKIGHDCYEAHLPSLITPKVKIQDEKAKRIRYAILEWHPLLDSSSMGYNDWIRIATEIELNYSVFDAFVVLHGTDTMGYTSSALSFLLEDLGKTVIVTGAQIPLSQLRNDAVDNLLGALTIAGQFIIPEVSLYFNHTLFRGNRVIKASSYDLDAFSSPNFPPLVDVGIDINVNWNDVLRPKSQKRFRAHQMMCADVVPIRIFPGITAATVRAFLAPHIRGAVLETFGAGNAPGSPEFLDAIKEACDRGVVIVTISQCSKGSVSDSYEAGRTLLNAGVVAGGDMTAPCALTKLAYLLSKKELSVNQVRTLIRTPLRGELTGPNVAVTSAGLPIVDSVSDLLAQVLRISSSASRFTPPVLSPSTSPSIALSGIPDTPPPITITGPQTLDPGPDFVDGIRHSVHEVAAPWSLTASDAASTQSALFPFLMHLAAARDDVDGLAFCIDSDNQLFRTLGNPGRSTDMSGNNRTRSGTATSATTTVPGGIVNCVDASTKMSPLHVAAMNGAERAVNILLRNGALVHQRDILDHTPLYYAARQGHRSIVQKLAKAGALLSGSDDSLGYVDHAVRRAEKAHDAQALEIWEMAGATMKKLM